MMVTVEVTKLIACQVNEHRPGVALVINSDDGFSGDGRDYIFLNATADTLRDMAANLARAAADMDEQEAAKCKKAA